ncbi:hypothetical protein HY419_00905, partial [candidate division WWE3 bacterium]|nr:hypothetical protein [candidate division WWE3 bacterium]
ACADVNGDGVVTSGTASDDVNLVSIHNSDATSDGLNYDLNDDGLVTSADTSAATAQVGSRCTRNISMSPKTPLNFTTASPASQQSYRVWAWADPSSSISETNEGDNQDWDKYQVTPLDFTIVVSPNEWRMDNDEVKTFNVTVSWTPSWDPFNPPPKMTLTATESVGKFELKFQATGTNSYTFTKNGDSYGALLDIASKDTPVGDYFVTIQGVTDTYALDKSTEILIKVRKRAWIQDTGGGDVGSLGDISSFVPAGRDNVDYLAVAEGTIINFSSAKNWLVTNYSASGGIETGFNDITKVYDELWARFGAGKAQDFNCSGKPLCTDLPVDNDVFAYPLAAAGNSGVGYPALEIANVITIASGKPTLIFVNADLNINGDINLTGGKRVVFIVKGDINVNPSVKTLNGFFLTQETFRSGFSIVAPATIPSQNIGQSSGIPDRSFAMAVGDDNLPRIMYYNTTNGTLVFSRCKGDLLDFGDTPCDDFVNEWTSVAVDTIGSSHTDAGMTLNNLGDGNPNNDYALIAHDVGGVTYIGCQNLNCTLRTEMTIQNDVNVTEGWVVNIDVGPNHLPQVSYGYETTISPFVEGLRYARCTGDGLDADIIACSSADEWQITTVKGELAIGAIDNTLDHSLAVGDGNLPQIVYGGSGNLIHFRCTGDGQDADSAPCNDAVYEWLPTSIESGSSTLDKSIALSNLRNPSDDYAQIVYTRGTLGGGVTAFKY